MLERLQLLAQRFVLGSQGSVFVVGLVGLGLFRNLRDTFFGMLSIAFLQAVLSEGSGNRSAGNCASYCAASDRKRLVVHRLCRLGRVAVFAVNFR